MDEVRSGVLVGLQVNAGLLADGHKVAWFAARLVVVRVDGKLVPLREEHPTGDFVEWLFEGELVRDSEGRLGIGALTVGPGYVPRAAESFDPGSYKLEPDPSQVVTAELLRLVSPPKLLHGALASLRGSKQLDEIGRRLGHKLLPDEHVAALREIDESKPRQRSIVTEEHLEKLARRYLDLVRLGARQPRAQLAEEFGLTPEQVRDRIHRARDLKFLTKGETGRASAEAGPRLKETSRKRPPPKGD